MSSLDRPARRHIRAKAVLTSSTSQDGIANCAPAISSAEAAAIASSSAMASRPPASSTAFMGLDPLSAEPDAVFEKLHVKAAEEFEQSVRDAYQESQAALRSLVSTQYPEMLGTASSVIEMAGSSRRLLQHITTFRDTALAPEPLGPSKLEKGKAREDDIAAETEIYRLAAATKVVDELPAFGRDFLSRRRAHPFTLHAAWAYMVGRTAWGYLSERTKMLAGSEAAVLFPSLVNKREELAALRTEVIQTCTKQLEQDLISYTAMMSHSIAMVLLDHARPSEMLQFVLGLRKRALAAMSYAGDTIDAVEVCCVAVARLMRIYSTSIRFSANAYILSPLPGTPPEFVHILEHICQARHGTEVPPHARLSARTIIDKISTKASLMNFLPDEIVKYCPFVDFSGAGTSQEEFDRALSQICTWSEDVISTCWQEQGLQSMFAGLATVADISSVAAAIFSYTSEVKQILRTSLHAGGDRTDAIHHTVDQSVDAFRSAAQRVLDERLVGLYRERLDDIARSFTYECDALTLEEPPDLIQWLLADGQGASLDDRLCGHTPAVRRVLAHAEQQASDVAQQMQRFWEDAPRSKEHSGHLEHLRKQFANSVTALFDSLASALQKIPRSANNILFAHVAAAIPLSTPLHQLAQAAQLDDMRERFFSIAGASVGPWVDAQVKDMLALYADRVKWDDLQSNVSIGMLDALCHLSSAIRHAGPALTTLGLKDKVLEAFAANVAAKGFKEPVPVVDATLLIECLADKVEGEAAIQLKKYISMQKAEEQVVAGIQHKFWAQHSLLLEPLLPSARSQAVSLPHHTQDTMLAPLSEPSIRVFRKIAV